MIPPHVTDLIKFFDDPNTKLSDLPTIDEETRAKYYKETQLEFWGKFEERQAVDEIFRRRYRNIKQGHDIPWEIYWQILEALYPL